MNKRVLILDVPIDSDGATVQVTMPPKPITAFHYARAAVALRECADLMLEMSTVGVPSLAQIEKAIKVGLRAIEKGKRGRALAAALNKPRRRS